jgi:hypothetical protein
MAYSLSPLHADKNMASVFWEVSSRFERNLEIQERTLKTMLINTLW